MNIVGYTTTVGSGYKDHISWGFETHCEKLYWKYTKVYVIHSIFPRLLC